MVRTSDSPDFPVKLNRLYRALQNCPSMSPHPSRTLDLPRPCNDKSLPQSPSSPMKPLLATILSLFAAVAMAQEPAQPTLKEGSEMPIGPVTSAKWIQGEPLKA